MNKNDIQSKSNKDPANSKQSVAKEIKTKKKGEGQTGSKDLGMLKSKSRDRKKFMFIKNIIKNMYQGASPKRPSEAPRSSLREPASRSEKQPICISLGKDKHPNEQPAKESVPQEEAKEDQETSQSKPKERDEETSMIQSREHNLQSKIKLTPTNKDKAHKEQETKSDRKREAGPMLQNGHNVILLFDDSSSESTILKAKTTQEPQDAPAGDAKTTEPNEKNSDHKQVARVSEKKEPAKRRGASVAEKYADVLRKLELKIGRIDYYLEKMKKLNSHWDEARYDINKYTNRENQLPSLYDYLQTHGLRPSAAPDKQGRLRLNRLNFMIQKITPRPSRNYEQFSLFESYLILKLFVLPQNQAQAQFDTEAVVQILSDYLGREKQSIYSQKENLENNTKFVNMVDLVEHLLFEHLGEDAQDFKFGRENEIVQIFEKEGTGVVRFSFLVDVFLLHFYILYNVTNFVDKMDMVIKIINALTNNSDFEIPQKYKLKTKWIKRVYYRTTKSKKRFIADYDFMIFNEEKYIEMISHFEEVIIRKGWKAGLVLTHASSALHSPSPSAPSLPDQAPKSVSFDGSIEDFTDTVISKVTKPKRTRRRGKRQKPRVEPPAQSTTNIDISHQSNHNYFLSKRELEAEREQHESSFKRVSRDTLTLDVHAKSPESGAQTRPAGLCGDDIKFLDFGIDHLKRRFDFGEIEAEELSHADKEVLAKLVGTDRQSQHSLELEMLRVLIKQESSSLKEFLRNASIVLRHLRQLDLTHLDSSGAISVSQVFYKIEKVLEFIRQTFFSSGQLSLSK